MLTFKHIFSPLCTWTNKGLKDYTRANEKSEKRNIKIEISFKLGHYLKC